MKVPFSVENLMKTMINYTYFSDILVARTSSTCYSIKMNKIKKKIDKSSGEKKALIFFSLVFVTVLVAAWIYAAQLRQTVAENNAAVAADPAALIEVERLRNIAESQISNARSYFLLNSKVLFDKQKQDRQQFADTLSGFEKKHSLPQIPGIIRQFEPLQAQLQEIFDQGVEFREKQTESKIIGQFYQAKAAPILKQMNDHLNNLKEIHMAELERIRAESRAAAIGVEKKIPEGMIWFIGLMTFTFVGVSIIVVRMLRERNRQISERDRLYAEAQKSEQARDEFISAISHDLKEPLEHLNQISGILTNFSESSPIQDSGELVKTSVMEIENRIKDICDQKMADQFGLTLRLDQIGIDDVLDDARIMMQPLAKQKDIRLQFDSANPPVLAFMDKERVMRVLANLISNAIKFSPKHSKVVVKVRSDQQFVSILVTDSGPGIPENRISDIFSHFWQARKTAEHGAGIGLAVVKTIVEAHGGSVKVSSAGGIGSIFTFTLPRRRPAGAQLKKPAPIRYTTVQRPQSEIYTDGPSL